MVFNENSPIGGVAAVFEYGLSFKCPVPAGCKYLVRME